MNRQTVDAVISLIKSALKSEPLVGFDSNISEEELKNIIKLAQAHRMLPMVIDSLVKSGVVQRETPVCNVLRKKQYSEILKSQKRDFELQRISELLERLGVKFIPLKGSVIKNLYPEPWMRTSCDIDVLILKEDIERVTEGFITELGYKRYSETFHDVSFNAESQVHIELHHTLVEDDYKDGVKRLLDSVWDYSFVKNGGCEMEMSPDMFMFYHIAHMAKHITLGGCGIRPFADLYFLRQRFDLDSEAFKSMLKSAELVTLFEAAMKLCDVWFSDAEHTDLSAQLEKFVLEGGVFGTVESALVAKRITGESNKKHVLKLLFLPRKQLELVYPSLKKCPYLFPVFQVRRWFRLLDSKKRKKYIGAVKIGSTLNEERIDKISLLMKELELK